jgi:hypothetical protein
VLFWSATNGLLWRKFGGYYYLFYSINPTKNNVLIDNEAIDIKVIEKNGID